MTRRGFTLVEVIVASSISSFLLIGVLSAFLMMGRTGANIRNYTEVEGKARAALEIFSRDARLAFAVNAQSPTSVTLSVPDTSETRDALSYKVTYALDTVQHTFNRTVENPVGTFVTEVLVQQVETIPGLNPFNYYQYVNANYANGFTTNTAATTAATKQIELNFVLKRKDVTVAEATNKVLSARFILRNK